LSWAGNITQSTKRVNPLFIFILFFFTTAFTSRKRPNKLQKNPKREYQNQNLQKSQMELFKTKWFASTRFTNPLNPSESCHYRNRLKFVPDVDREIIKSALFY